MKSNEASLSRELTKALKKFSIDKIQLTGITDPANFDCFLKQLIDSVKSIKFIEAIKQRGVDIKYTDPSTPMFDPIKASIWHEQDNNIEEAFWLVFLLTHFGKNRRTKWELIRNVYLGKGLTNGIWNWTNVASDLPGFINWLSNNQVPLKAVGKFGNHRKYQSLDAYKSNGTGSAVKSYLHWISNTTDHKTLIASAISKVGSDPTLLFDFLYKEMESVISFVTVSK